MADTIELKVPDIGDFDEVTVIEVLVAPGDSVSLEQSLVTLESDKATMEVPASQAGTIQEVRVKVGDTVSEGTVLVLLTPSAEQPPDTAPQQKTVAPIQTGLPRDDAMAQEPTPDEHTPVELAQPPSPSRAPIEFTNKVGSDNQSFQSMIIDRDRHRKAHASPAVRRFARELGVDLGVISGSGRKQRILKEDVQAYVKQALSERPAAANGAGIPPIPAVDFSRWGEIEEQPLSRIKKISGPRLQRAWLNLPHVTQFDQADITELEAFRVEQRAAAEQQDVRLTLLAFLVRACARALQEFPEVNSSLSAAGDALILKKYINIGVAVDTDEGLVVPVIKDAERKGIYQIAVELTELSSKARDKKLSPSDLQGGTFSISSLGGIGGTAFTPIVNAPEVAILGISRAELKPVWDGEAFQPRLMLPLSFSYDHRVIDGAAAVRFTTYLAKLLGDIRQLLL